MEYQEQADAEYKKRESLPRHCLMHFSRERAGQCSKGNTNLAVTVEKTVVAST
jgi:hypothetical protein